MIKPFIALPETNLQLELRSLEPHERRDFTPSKKDANPEVRFWQVARRGEIDRSLLHWLNPTDYTNSPRPIQPHIPNLEPRPIEATPKPIVEFSGTPGQLGHLYSLATRTIVASSEIVECIDFLDPAGFSWIPIEIVGVPSHRRYCWGIPTRWIDPIRVEYSKFWIERRPGWSGGSVCIPKLWAESYSIRSDIPEDIHIFGNVFGWGIYWSNDLVRFVVESGATGFYVKHTQRYRRRETRYI